ELGDCFPRGVPGGAALAPEQAERDEETGSHARHATHIRGQPPATSERGLEIALATGSRARLPAGAHPGPSDAINLWTPSDRHSSTRQPTRSVATTTSS